MKIRELAESFKHRYGNLVFLLPALLVLSFVVLYPILYAIQRSLYDWFLLSPDKLDFIGFGNYWEALHDPKFWYSTRITLVYTAGTTTTSVLLGLLLAVLLSGPVYGKGMVRTLFLIPMIMTPVALAIVWKVWFWEPYFGLINYFLSFLGIKGPIWLADPLSATIAIIITGVWIYVPFCVLVLEAAISRVPKEVCEAATIDGASRWKMFTNVTLPLIKFPLIFVILFRVSTDFKYFDVPYVMTQGGPGFSTQLLSLHVYFEAMRKFRLGYSNATGILMMIMALAICLLIIRVRSRTER